MKDTNGNLADKTAWITGSSRGIGRMVAHHLASRGAAVVVHGTTPVSTKAFNEADSLQSVALEISRDCSAEVAAVHGDLSDETVVDVWSAKSETDFTASISWLPVQAAT